MEHFVHVSDVESDFVPLKGDQASLDFSSNLKYCVCMIHTAVYGGGGEPWETQKAQGGEVGSPWGHRFGFRR